MYAGQNLEQMCKVYVDAATELDKAGHYEHTLTQAMIRGFQQAGGKGHADSLTFHYQ
jgi:hypothetical protein